ncbi:MAG: hypothetical protein ABSD44_11450 [Terracidiphilus sp.]
MPTKTQHVQKAEGNETFAKSIDTTSQARIDWKLVILFYAAVHYVEAYLAMSSGTHLRSHTTRDNYISKESNLKKIRVSYAHLKYYGYNARYEFDGFTAKDVREASGYLSQVKAELVPLLNA